MEPRPEYVPENKSPKKQWYCLNCMHTLGLIYRGARGLEHLRIEHQELMVDTVMGVTVTCPVCKSQREWQPGEETLRDMFDRRVNVFDRRAKKLV